MRLAKKVAIVTGGASGFGLGIVRRFVAEGARVVIVDISEENGAAVSKELGDESTLFVNADVSKAESWRQILAFALTTFGQVDIVVNNAGVTYRNQPTVNVTEDDFDRVFSVNVKSVYHSFSSIVPYLVEKGSGGVFVQISSTAALRPRPGLTWYNATKGAVSIASKSMAVEYGRHKIRFNCICPVAGDTPLLASFMGGDTPEHRDAFLKTVPIGRFAQPSDIASAAVFLASDEAEFITGVDLEVDGGRCV